MRKLLCVPAALGLVLLVACPAWAEEAKAASPDVKAQAARAKEMVDAFNRGDAKALAEFWTPDGDYMDELGHLYKGRKAIAESFQKLFAEGKGAQLRIHKTAFRFVRPDLLITDGIMEVVPPGGGPTTSARYTSVQVKHDGKWFVESFRECVAVPPSQGEKLEDLAWLIGAWAGEGAKGPSATLSFSWAENNNFIVNHFATTLQDVPVAGGTQWIAWDAAAKSIRAWVFDSTGSISEAVWTRDGNRLTSKTTTTLPDGKRATSTNIVTRIDPNQLTWQSTNRSVDGKKLPDTEVMKLKRVQ
jgi:uncharacterized protein (TIGR02246 family)